MAAFNNRYRKIYFSRKVAESIINDKRAFEAFAFAMLLKTRYINSEFRNATIRNLNKEFGIGYNKLVRILKKGIELGFIERTPDGGIIARPMKNKGEFAIFIKVEKIRKYKLKEIEYLLRRNKSFENARSLDVFASMIKLGKEPADRWDQKKARRFAFRKALNTSLNLSGFSMVRWAQATGLSVKTARKLIQSLVAEGLITIERDVRKFERRISEVPDRGVNAYVHDELNLEGGYFYNSKHCTWEVRSNIYHTHGRLCRWIY